MADPRHPTDAPYPADRALRSTGGARAGDASTPTGRAGDSERLALFEATPGASLALLPDAPRFTVVAATAEYLRATGTTRDALVGRGLFEALPDDLPADLAPTAAVAELRASLDAVLRTGTAHRMADYRYDVRQPDGRWEERWWATVHVPVRDAAGEVRYLVHQAVDVTAQRAAAARTAAMQDTTAALARALTAPEVAEAVATHALPALAAASTHVALLDAGGRALDVAGAVGLPPDLLAAWQGVPLASPLPMCDAVRTREAVLVPSREVLDARYPALRDTADRLGIAAMAALPLVFEGATLGALVVVFGSTHAFGACERAFLDAMAAQCALALERARLFDAERQARAEAERLAREKRAVLEQLAEGVVLADEDGRLALVSHAVQRLVGPGAALGMPVEACVAACGMRTLAGEPLAPEHFALVRAVRHGETVRDRRWRLRRADGGECVVQGSAGPVRGDDGRQVGAVLTLHDVTVEQQAVEALLHSEERYALAAQATSNVIWDWDLVTDALTWSPGLYEVFGYASGEVPDGVTWRHAAIHPDDRAAVEAGLRQAIEGDATAHEWRAAYRFRRGDGTWAQVIDRGYVARGRDGRAVRMIGAMEDVTAQRAVEADSRRLLHEAQAARRDAEKASRAKSEFLAVMSHELRTPLNAIGGYAELIALGIRGPVSDQQRADLQRIQASQRHLLGLINEVLNYARLESGAVRYDLTDVHLGDVLRAAEGLVAPQARARGLVLEVASCPADLRVRTDADKLRQVLLNLLGNAVKFTNKREGLPGRISVRVETPEAGAVLVHVEDTGIGIPGDKLEQIFEPFVQVMSGRNREHEGTGLGLAISRDLARGMGGDLTVVSTPGVGSTFTIALPRAR